MLEVSAIAAGLPMAASFAMAGGFVALREGRRRSALNAAIHELRRPLQALYLSLPAGSRSPEPLESSLEMAVAAVERLDRELNGGESVATERLLLRRIAETAAMRWQPAARRDGRLLRMRWIGRDPIVDGDPIALAQMLDNLISNSLEHGEGAISVEVETVPRQVRLAVRDGGPGGPPRGRRPRLDRLGGRNRHGHGLGIVRRTAALHGGSFRLDRSASGTEAVVLLPLAEDEG